ncbi:uncharacterized protein LAESUDRAFT_645955 [Laetiporus sulphureus 93-53]|uniref:CCZ1/INTU/HSP4 first Longin domain-containing protein n=1 Tax=Laetiporus sulphureus 93-53 TaxID=1314785 RepID=A0A165G856_9APHY|nr:uncharacterized protein LAESUDRAFT_645955 [Laetiporus sulphureus 93-53]KZT09961.1 hypothetical protein LAESUDRAFT_645955 [Laetiporus sulphureus 93-53]
MSKIPASLLYFTIFNPTLRPAAQFTHEDEDAVEQAQILFYTARDPAVSRDRMLRQVGLAKALISFSSIFNPGDLCESIHSQRRRSVFVSPEPNYWIHACFELARVPRAATVRDSSRTSTKNASKKQDVSENVIYEYQDYSVEDVALRAQIMNGYDDFVLIHGSFTSVLSTAGQETLETQLEKFFSMWVWSWDISKKSGALHIWYELPPTCMIYD